MFQWNILWETLIDVEYIFALWVTLKRIILDLEKVLRSREIWKIWVNYFDWQFRDHGAFMKPIYMPITLTKSQPRASVPQRGHSLKDPIHGTETNFKITQVIYLISYSFYLTYLLNINLIFWIPWKSNLVHVTFLESPLFPLHCV